MVQLEATQHLPRLVLIGGGWGNFYVAEKIDYTRYAVTLISPRRTQAYTPLLASAAVGLFNFSLAEEPIRSRYRKALRFFKANATNVDFNAKTITCSPAFDDEPGFTGAPFTVEYDVLIIAPGCTSNTFNTPGVAEHSIFVKNVSDAMRIRKRLFDLLELASLPTISRDQAEELLHVAIVGGGPTGIELCAELSDLASHELKDLYPDVADLISISVYDVAPNILSSYDASLHKYATGKLAARHVNVKTETHIERVDSTALYTKEQGRIPYGMLLWATGNKNVELIDTIAPSIHLPEKGLKRVLTDGRLRVFLPKGDAHYDSVYAIGDAADIIDSSLPTTAEVAVQKAKYLVENLNSVHDNMAQPFSRPFLYSNKSMVSYIGSHDGVLQGATSKSGQDDKWTGQGAWLAWRRGTLSWNRNWRSRVAIIITWILNAVFGKEIARL